MSDYINTIDSLKPVGYTIKYIPALLLLLCTFIVMKIADRQSSKIAENKQIWIAFIGAMIELLIAGYIVVGTIVLSYAWSNYDKAYQNGLYNHYSEYKDNVKSVKVADGDWKFNVIVNVDNTDYTIDLDRFENTYEEVETPDSEESYYELFRDTTNKRIGIRKHVGSLELDERHGERTSNTFKETDKT